MKEMMRIEKSIKAFYKAAFLVRVCINCSSPYIITGRI